MSDQITHADAAELEKIEPFTSVMDFMVAGKQATWGDEGVEGFGSDPESAMRILRRSMLMDEDDGEAFEYLRGDEENDIVEALDGLCDTIYVAVGTLIKYCKDNPYLARLMLQEVCRSNMSKVQNGELIKQNGKIMKGPNYSPARIAQMVKQFELDK